VVLGKFFRFAIFIIRVYYNDPRFSLFFRGFSSPLRARLISSPFGPFPVWPVFTNFETSFFALFSTFAQVPLRPSYFSPIGVAFVYFLCSSFLRPFPTPSKPIPPLGPTATNVAPFPGFCLVLLLLRLINHFWPPLPRLFPFPPPPPILPLHSVIGLSVLGFDSSYFAVLGWCCLFLFVLFFPPVKALTLVFELPVSPFFSLDFPPPSQTKVGVGLCFYSGLFYWHPPLVPRGLWLFPHLLFPHATGQVCFFFASLSPFFDAISRCFKLL